MPRHDPRINLLPDLPAHQLSTTTASTLDALQNPRRRAGGACCGVARSLACFSANSLSNAAAPSASAYARGAKMSGIAKTNTTTSKTRAKTDKRATTHEQTGKRDDPRTNGRRGARRQARAGRGGRVAPLHARQRRAGAAPARPPGARAPPRPQPRGCGAEQPLNEAASLGTAVGRRV